MLSRLVGGGGRAAVGSLELVYWAILEREMIQCLLLAQSGHHDSADRCPLSGVKRTSVELSEMSASDPKRTFGSDIIRTT